MLRVGGGRCPPGVGAGEWPSPSSIEILEASILGVDIAART